MSMSIRGWNLVVVMLLATFGSAAAADRPVGEIFRDCPECPEMVVVPAGRFVMGSATAETAREKVFDRFAILERPQHEVAIAHPFAVGRTHVTRGEFRAFVEATGYRADGCVVMLDDGNRPFSPNTGWGDSGFEQTDRHPVVCISFEDARQYVRWLNRKLGYGDDGPYSLPSEAEWEYVARAGTSTTHYWGDDREGVCQNANAADLSLVELHNWGNEVDHIFQCHDGFGRTAPVMSFRPNGFGVFDIFGNAEQWMLDCWNESYAGAPTDGSARTDGNCAERVARGGSWKTGPRYLRAAARDHMDAIQRVVTNGFRVVRRLP